MLYATHVGLHLLFVPVLLGVLYFVRRSAESAAAQWMIRLLVFDLIWVLMILLGLLLPGAGKELLYPVSTSIGMIVPIVWLAFTLYYTGRGEFLTRPVWAVLVLSHGFVALMNATNSVHGLMFSELVVVEEPFAYVVATETTLQLALSVVPFVSASVGIFVLIDFILSTKHLSRAQSLAMVGGAATATAVILVWLLERGPAPGFNYSGIAAGLFGTAVGWALFNDDLFRVAPVARDSVFASFSDPLVTVDKNGTVVDFNGAAQEVFPAIQSHLGDPLGELEPALLTAEDDTAVMGMDDPSSTITDSFVTAVDGKQRSFRLETSTIEGGNRQVVVVLHFRDVTELERRTDELERRTAQLETKSQQLEQFASSVSHDLRNPINVAMGRIELTRETGELDHLTPAEEAMDRGLATIEELLELAKSGQTIGEPQEFELATIVDEAWQTVDTKAAKLETDLTDWTIRADRGRVQGLLENLFRNSIEHGGTDLTVTVGRADDGFFVADDGPGIPEEQRDKVFDHGYTGGDGTGLGLAKVEAIAVAHDWTVSVKEGESGGARFVFGNVSSTS